MSNMTLYMIGAVLVTAALAYGAHLLGIAPTWIAIGSIVILGASIMGAVKKTRRREVAPD